MKTFISPILNSLPAASMFLLHYDFGNTVTFVMKKLFVFWAALAIISVKNPQMFERFKYCHSIAVPRPNT